ncbi:MAG: NADH-quinone oxidoreductase subunit L [Planctomyces sp.]|nr:NADH-quinone oxidoreductase subunit L [Planctomyces sp.]
MSETTQQLILWLIPVAPLLSAVITGLFGPGILRYRSHLPCWAALAVSFVCSLILLLKILPGVETGALTNAVENAATAENTSLQLADKPEVIATGYQWLHVGSISVDVQLRADSMTAIMLSMVTGVSLLVAMFGSGYMHHDPGYPRFFAAVSLFVFSMCMLVLAGSFLMLFVFWEAVGLCSYLLIGFWFQKPSAAAAAKKAFVVNRIGDFGLIMGMFLIWQTSHNDAYPFLSLNFSDIFGNPELLQQIAAAQPERVKLICLCLFLGAMGKSAQFPLQVWLPDAMEGPTPVSALIHAATMVTAGVYLVARCTPLFVLAPDAQLVVTGVGATTAAISALIGLTQTDLKRVLAYSTVSQLGFMFMALGCGAAGPALVTPAVTAGMFHLFTHAYFKALLFLAAGSVMHAMGDVIDMNRFSGLRKALPITHWTFLFGAAALAGVPLMAGFWSKDDILAVLGEASQSEKYGSFFSIIRYVAMGTAALTAFYTFRAYFKTFWGPEKFPEEAGHHPHDASLVMAIPLGVLAACSVLVGLAFGPTHMFAGTLQRIQGLTLIDPSQQHLHWGVMAVSAVIAAVGIGGAWFFYVANPKLPGTIAGALKPFYAASTGKFYLDEIFTGLIVIPLYLTAKICVLFDRFVIDGIVDAFGAVPKMLSAIPRHLHSGIVNNYAGVMWAGVVAAVVLVLSIF